MKLIIGLGNPGKRYAKNRHNAGFMAIDVLRELFESQGAIPWELSKKFNAEISGCSVRGEKIILAKPMTYMNDSGIAVQLLASFYRVPPRDIIVIHDDKDIALGEIKIQKDRGHAGHNGVRSIMERIGSEEFTRARLGIKSENEKKMADAARFVLGNFGLMEKRKVAASIRAAAAAVKNLLEKSGRV